MLNRERSSPSTTPEPHDIFLHRLASEAEVAMARLEAPCGWCGIACIGTRSDHERYLRESELTWRERAA